jgi:hypothetical protein
MSFFGFFLIAGFLTLGAFFLAFFTAGFFFVFVAVDEDFFALRDFLPSAEGDAAASRLHRELLKVRAAGRRTRDVWRLARLSADGADVTARRAAALPIDISMVRVVAIAFIPRELIEYTGN